MISIVSGSAAKTELLGRKFSHSLNKQDVLLLEGELGGGKTTFVKGLAAGLGYKGRVLSPTFTLARHYQAKKLNIYHLDLYRLEKGDFGTIDIEGYLYDKKAVSVVEWGEKLEAYLDKFLRISFLFLDINKRKLLISQKGYDKNKLGTFAG